MFRTYDQKQSFLLPPALESMKQELGAVPEKLVTDAGYANKATLDNCREHEVLPVCATGWEGKESSASKIGSPARTVRSLQYV